MTSRILKPAMFLIFGLILIGVAWWLTKPVDEKQNIQRQRHEFFTVTGIQILNQEEERNRAAMERARQQLASNFARYRRGVPEFAEDLTTWGTRYKIAKAALADWWSDSNEARKVATDQFAKFVVSDQQLQRDVIATIDQFSSDLEANRNIMLNELHEKVSIAAVPCASTDLSSSNLTGACTEEVKSLLARRSADSLVVGVIATGGGFVAGEAKIVTKLLSSMATRVATGAAARGSAVAAGAIAGGEGGTIITPGVGTAIGIVGGIVVGGAVDWWMEGRFKEKVTNECTQILNDMEESLWNDPKQGLASAFDQTVKANREAHETALRKIITGGEK